MSFKRGIIIFIYVFVMLFFNMTAAHFDWNYISSFKTADILRLDSDYNLLGATLTPYSRFNLIDDKKS